MKLENKRILVTGGAGFIGSHLVDVLVAKNSIVIADNRPSDKRKALNGKARYVNINLLDKGSISSAMENMDLIIHLAANPLASVTDSSVTMGNVNITHNILEAMKENGVGKIAFASSAIIYGDAPTPTKETYGPLKPQSLYGASKLACEALISAYCHSFSMASWIFRFANVGGPRLRHGPIFDFIAKLRQNPAGLEVLGDGSQQRSYMHISDCVNGVVRIIENANSRVNIVNLGSEDAISVGEIAKIVIGEMGLKPKIKFSANEAKGWKGDIKMAQPDISLAKSLGWEPEYNSEQTVRETVKSLLKEV